MINLDVDYQYISMIKKYKSQYIIEGCAEHTNFKIIIHTDNLFEEEIPSLDHCTSLSGGLSDKIKSLTASAP